VLGKVDGWLAEVFAPDAIDGTVAQLTERAERLEDPPPRQEPKPLVSASPATTLRSAATGRASTPGETPP
jgi:hypothetical protein